MNVIETISSSQDEEASLFQSLDCEATATISGGHCRGRSFSGGGRSSGAGGLFSLFNFDTYATAVLVGTVLGIPADIARIIGFFKAIRQF